MGSKATPRLSTANIEVYNSSMGFTHNKKATRLA